MLELLHIQNFAIIDELEIEFDRGLTALTGETGAGKSILLDALKLISGERADNDMIRAGESRAEVSASFDLSDAPDANRWLQDNELDSDNECVLRRILTSGGRSRASINGSSVTVEQLRQLTDYLFDIHGQHEHQSLLHRHVQLSLLDGFLKESELIDSVQNCYRSWKQLRDRLDSARHGDQAREQRIDLLKIYTQELQSLDLQSIGFEELKLQHRRLANAENLISVSSSVVNQLYDDESGNVQAQLNQSISQLDQVAEQDKQLQEWQELLNSALIQVEEAVSGLRDYRENLELDDELLSSLNEQIAERQRLARKHQVEAEDLLTLSDRLQAELDNLESDSNDLESLERQLQAAEQKYLELARQLSDKRQQAASALGAQIQEVMATLGMPGGQFVIEVLADENQFRNHGIDQVNYLVSTNAGQPSKPLSRVASGGELSRISLAIQVITSEYSHIPTLLFDEVDSGVGGGVAEIVGRKMRLLGNNRQVFCITHLPQVASQGHYHLKVSKQQSADSTTTMVLPLHADERVEEVSRMLGGLKITEQTRAHASEMISLAE